jgi:hypothetical protein
MIQHPKVWMSVFPVSFFFGRISLSQPLIEPQLFLVFYTVTYILGILSVRKLLLLFELWSTMGSLSTPCSRELKATLENRLSFQRLG